MKARLPPSRGYFAIGIEGISKAVNLGNLLRSAHAFGASFVFTIAAELTARCQHLVRIPAAFSLNVATAGAIVMYDRLRSLGPFASRPVSEGAGPVPEPPHVRGAPRKRRRQR